MHNLTDAQKWVKLIIVTPNKETKATTMMETAGSNALPFVGVLVKDKKTNGFTAFFKQFPNVIAEGDTEDQAIENLIKTLRAVLECDIEDVDIPDGRVTQKTITFEPIPA